VNRPCDFPPERIVSLCSHSSNEKTADALVAFADGSLGLLLAERVESAVILLERTLDLYGYVQAGRSKR
jgi:hypothetical protein